MIQHLRKYFYSLSEKLFLKFYLISCLELDNVINFLAVSYIKDNYVNEFN